MNFQTVTGCYGYDFLLVVGGFTIRIDAIFENGTF
jgi:hypothetical protein